MEKAIYCIAKNPLHTENIINQLKSGGFTDDSISVLFPDKSTTRDFAYVHHTKTSEGATTGEIMGAGVILGLLAGIGTLAIPGAGPFIAAGPIVGALSGAGADAAEGGLIGALTGAGIPEHEARRYEGKIKDGGILLCVHTENFDQRLRVKDIFERANAEDITTTREKTAYTKERV
ncbi:MAG: hypothetical protein ACXWTK_02110 [Methylobacter sp.]